MTAKREDLIEKLKYADSASAGHPPEPDEQDWNELQKQICGRCYDTVEELFPPKCKEKPELLIGVPLGQYHCRDCGAMVVAGIPHPTVCKRCRDLNHPDFDKGEKA